MKKIFFMLVACIGMATTVSAQYSRSSSSSSSDGELSRFHMGIRGGVTSSSISDGGDALAFPYGGIAMDFKIAPIPLYLESGVYYMNKGYSYDSYYGSSTYDDNSVVVPIVVSYHIPVMPNKKMSVQPFLGGFVSYGFDSEEEDYGIRVGCGWNFGRLYANVGYDFGLKSFENRYNDFTTNSLFVTIGFNWVGSK